MGRKVIQIDKSLKMGDGVAVTRPASNAAPEGASCHV